MRNSIKNDKSILDLMLHNFDKPVVVILTEANELNIVDKKIEIWAVYDELKQTYPITPKLHKTDIMYILQLCVNNNLGLKLNGLVKNTEFVFDADELIKVDDVITTTTWLVKYLKREIDEKTLISKIENIDVYFIGNLPSTGLKGEQFGVSTLRAVEGNKDMIPVFLLPENSNRFNAEKLPLTKTKLKYIMHFYNIFDVIIEPGEKHWVLLHN